jgi:cell division protein FtsB
LYFGRFAVTLWAVTRTDSRTGRRSEPDRGRRRRIVHWLVMLFAAVVVVDAIVGEQGLLATLRARREYEQLAATIERQRAENSRLREEARRLREDPAAIEEIARRELGLIRRGEKVIILKDLPPATP